MKKPREQTKSRLLVGLSVGFLAVAFTLLALEISLFLHPLFGENAILLLFLPPIVLAAWYGGIWPGILATFFATFLLSYFFFPTDSLANMPPASFLQLGLFAAEGCFISFVIHRTRRSDKVILYERMEKQYQKRIAALEQEHARAEKEIRTRDEFLSVASHELKTPLTAMLLQTQTALYNIRNVSLAHFSIESLLKMLEGVESQTKRLSKMINDLLNVSLITTGKMDLEAEEVNLGDIVRGVVESLSEKLEKGGSALTVENGVAVVGFWDPLRIEQAATNLLSNAIKYGKGKPITLRVSKEDGMAKLSIQDGGIGIAQENQERIFGLFERAVSSPEYKGLGVGLFITRQIVKAHKGSITVTSRPGQGATFTVLLPMDKPTMANSKAIQSENNPENPETFYLKTA